MTQEECVEAPFTFWQDREIRFDGPPKTVDLRGKEEVLIRIIPRVEDTKGNNGLVGTMMLTNLRIIWYASTRQERNLSVGFFTIKNITIKEANSKLGGGVVSSLFVTAKYGSSRFQFVFTATGNAKEARRSTAFSSASTAEGQRENLFSLAHMIWKAYESTKMYREVRLRTALTDPANQNQLVLLPQEKVVSQHPRFINLTKEESFSGLLILTNIRLVWLEELRPAFNVSVPYIQIIGLRLQIADNNTSNKKKSKIQLSGKSNRTLVVQTSSYGGNFKFGFCAMQGELTSQIFSEVRSLWEIAVARPVFGVKVEAVDGDAQAANPPNAPPSRSGTVGGSALKCSPASRGPRSTYTPPVQSEGSNHLVFEEAPIDHFAGYYADEEGGKRSKDRDPVYDVGLGLAVEKLKKGTSVRDLWKVSVRR